MTDLKAFWNHRQTPQAYQKQMDTIASGVSDEKIAQDFINSYLKSRLKVIVDLGIGTGRELVWLDKLHKVSKIIGIDYSRKMLDYCTSVSTKYKHTVYLFQDDLLKPLSFPSITKDESKPIIYLSLINTFGNFTREERLKALINIKDILKSSDRIVLALYKNSQDVKMKIPKYLKTELAEDAKILAELIEYSSIQFFWDPVIEKYKTLPRFWYDKKGDDIVIHVDGKRLLTSHRFAREEIMNEFSKSGLKVNKLIEGRAMWIAIGKK